MKTKLKIVSIILLGFLFYLRIEFFSERIKHFTDVQISNTDDNIKMLSEIKGLSKKEQSTLNVYGVKSREIGSITRDEAGLFEKNLIVMIVIMTAAGVLSSLPLSKKYK